jgi:hypothetical protein
MTTTIPLANGDAPFQTINTFADGNYGLQTGINTGHVNAVFHQYAPGRLWRRPTSHAAERER